MDGTSPQPIRSREYKSRRNRPCDFCRTRKVACTIETQPPCQLCRVKNRPCTFVKGPGFRRRSKQASHFITHNEPLHQGEDDQNEQNANISDTIIAIPLPEYGLPSDPHESQQHQCSDTLPEDDSIMFDFTQSLDSLIQFPDENASQSPPGNVTADVPLQSSASPVEIEARSDSSPTEEQSLPSRTLSLDQQSGKSYRFVGPSGELDAHLIARRSFNEDFQSSSPYTEIHYQHTRPVEKQELDFQPPSVFTVGDTSLLEKAQPKLELGSLNDLRVKFEKLVDASFGRELIRIFFEFIQPSFPILSVEQVPSTDEQFHDMSLPLLAAICASSLPFIIYDDALSLEESKAPSDTDLYFIAWTALQLESPDVRLTTIQTYLLILQRQSRDDLFGEASFNWRLCAMMVSSSQTIGLNRDPTDWVAIEPWERRLRKQLWWAIFVTETWTAFGQGMSSHINPDDCDVPVLNEDEFTEPVNGEPVENTSKASNIFYHLTSLTMILRDIATTFFSVRGMKQSGGDLQLALNLAKPLRARLMQWHQGIPEHLRLSQTSNLTPTAPSADWLPNRLQSSASLKLAYIVAQVSLFRALERPLAMTAIVEKGTSERPSFWESDGAIAVILGAIQSAKELVRLIESLTAADWDSFWHSWSKHNFAIASTFLMHILILTQPSQSGSLSGTSPQQESPGALAAAPITNSNAGGLPQTGNQAFVTEYSELQNLTKRWRWALRLAERGAGGRKGLMSASLRRVEALFREWQIGKTDFQTAKTAR